MPARFTRVQIYKGFDDNSGRPWLMAPLQGFNYANLEGPPRLRLEIRNPQIASFQATPFPGGFRVSVRGLRRGDTALEAFDPGTNTPAATLEISVLQNKTVPISFHFLTDTNAHVTAQVGATNSEYQMPGFNPNAPMRTLQWPTDSQAMSRCVEHCLRDLNDIYPPQANLTFALRNFKQDVIRRDLQPRVNAYSVRLLQELRTLKDTAAKINVFFAWDLVLLTRQIVGWSMKPRSDGICLVDDTTMGNGTRDYVGQAVSHEVGHLLLAGMRFNHFVGRHQLEMLMHVSGAPASRMIPKTQAIYMNQHA